MPTTYPVTLTATGPVPPTLPTHPGDKVIWTNNVSVNGVGVSIQLTLPMCVSPHGTVTIAPNASSQLYSIRRTKGSYPYYYSFPDKKMKYLAVQTGTIDVS